MISTNKSLFSFSIFFFICATFFVTAAETHESQIVKEFWQQDNSSVNIKTPYGKFTIEEPILIQLLKSEPVQRLKYIHQYGPGHYVKGHVLYKGNIQCDYTRWEHSICIFTLARLKQLPLAMQIAALLHDLSHTAFSHVGDFVFGENEHTKDAYQDDILKQYLEDHGITDIVRKHNKIVRKHNKNDIIVMQKVLQKPSFLDKTDYTLIGGLLAGELRIQDLKYVVNHLCFESKNEDDINLKKTDGWFFDNQESALVLGRLSLKMDSLNSGAPWNTYVYRYMAKALVRAFELKLFTQEDFSYNISDDDLWNVLVENTDDIIQHYLYKVIHHEEILEYLSDSDSDRNSAEPEDRTKNRNRKRIEPATYILPKFRGLDPNVYDDQWGSKVVPLTILNDDYRIQYLDAKRKVEYGQRISNNNHQKSIPPITPRPQSPGKEMFWCGK